MANSQEFTYASHRIPMGTGMYKPENGAHSINGVIFQEWEGMKM